MRQVPQYLIIGNGCVATHIQHYFKQLDLSFSTWSRRRNDVATLIRYAKQATHILLLISDDSMESFILEHPFLLEKTICHFSGSLIHPSVPSAHPLYPFTKALFQDEIYKTIPFIIEQEGPCFSSLLPGLPNTHYQIPRKSKPLYHALCVLSGNFSTILWQKFFEELQLKFNLPIEVGQTYLQAITRNLLACPHKALTGPLQRQDQKTINANLKALEQDDFYEVYESFVKIYSEEVV